MASRLPPLIIGALLACAVVASAEKPTPTPGPLTEEQVRQTLERIVIPKLELRDASLREALDFLSKEAQRLDPKKRGIPFHVRIEPPIPAASMVPGIPGTLTPAPAPANPESLLNPDDAKITVSLTNISLSEALRYVTGLANLKFRIRPDGVHIVSLQDPEPMFTRDLRIPADFFSASEKQDRIDHSDLVAMIKKDFRQFLIANGVRFDEPAAAILDDRGKRLTVHNTKDQIELIETILRTPTASPTALEIESKKRDAQERASKAAIRRKMETIVLHEISLVNVSLKSAVETLKKLSWKHDRRSPAKVRGVNLILRNPEDEAPKTADSVSEILGLSAPPAAPVNSTPTPLPTEPLITYSATKVTVQQAELPNA